MLILIGNDGHQIHQILLSMEDTRQIVLHIGQVVKLQKMRLVVHPIIVLHEHMTAGMMIRLPLDFHNIDGVNYG